MIKTEMLRVFVEVARAGNLVTAAEALGRAPSAVSMTLKQLEAHLGQPLFESERKSRLTALGAYAFEMANRELTHFDRTIAALTGFRGGPVRRGPDRRGAVIRNVRAAQARGSNSPPRRRMSAWISMTWTVFRSCGNSIGSASI